MHEALPVSNTQPSRLHSEMAQARELAAANNREAALDICSRLQSEFASSPQPYILAASLLQQLRRHDEADALLTRVLENFSDIAPLFIEFALIATHRREWELAALRWESVRERFPNSSEGYSFGVATLREARQFEESAAIAAEALPRFSNDFRLLFESGLLARQLADLSGATLHFENLRKFHPKRAEGYSFGSLVLREAQRFKEAEALVAEALSKFPSDFRLLQEYGMLARQQGDHVTAITRYTALRERYPNNHEGYTETASVLTKLGRYAEASGILAVAKQRLPADPGVLIEEARVASAQKNWTETVSLCEILRERFSNQPSGYFLAIGAMLRLGRFDEAEELGRLGRQTFPKNIDILVWSAKAATHRCDWSSAMPRWDEAMRIAPNNPMVLEGMALARQAQEFENADQKSTAKGFRPAVLHSQAVGKADISDKKFLLRFESLGDNCEFGLVQRLDGLEPLGLLRWATTYSDNLVAMLETRFSGVGDIENTSVDLGSSGEWHARDSRYFGMHTFIYDPTLDSTQLSRKMSRRFQFLRDKLIEDLELAEKIFVYKKCNGVLNNVELRRITAGLRLYAPNVLLYVRKAEKQEQEGTVEDAGNGLIIGYLSDMTADPQAVRGYGYKWKHLCELAWRVARPSLE